MFDQGKYFKKEFEFLDRNSNSTEHGWTANGHKKEDKIYTYDEALDLAGRGWYTYGLVAFVILAIQGMALDMFGPSVVVAAACDFNLTLNQKTILLSMPLIGSIVMAWPWGYIADTQGRRKALAFSLWGGFILSTLSAFSPNWIVLAVLKFGGSSMSSGIQSLGYTLLGECCSQKLRSPFLIIVGTSLTATYGTNMVLGYLTLNLDIWVDLDFVTFSSWRLLILVYALFLGLPAVFLPFIFESPKFLLNAGKEKEAVEIIRNIMRRNGGDESKYPVKKIVLKETTTLRLENVPLWQSLRDQTVPLFKPPLLYKIIHLFYLTAVIYAVNNGFSLWLPFVLDTFYSGYQGNSTAGGGICDMIVNSNNLASDTQTCVGKVKEFVLWTSVIQAVVFSVLNIGVFILSRWKKSVLVCLMLFTCVCGVVIPAVTERMTSVVLFIGFLSNCLSISIIFSYYVDLIPTSYRGMAACLGVMVARGSALAGTNLVGSYIDSHCSTSFYAWSAYLLSGAVLSCFLPSDSTNPV